MTVASMSARDRFQAAYENRYTWDDQFPGYTAEVELRQGDEVYRAQMTIGADLGVSISGVDDPDVLQTLERQLKDITTHRQRADFAKVHGENQFQFGDTDASGAIAILVEGKAMGSSYKVRDREICHVERNVGPMRFVIDTHATLDTGNGYVPTRTDAIFFNAQSGQPMKEVHYEDTYEKIGDYHLLAHQVIRARDCGDAAGPETVTEITFTNLQLR